MKFYTEDKNKNKYNYNYWHKINKNKLTAIYSFYSIVWFFKNGLNHNDKNASYIKYNIRKEFHLNGKKYGSHYNFTKQSWRKFVKLMAFI
jgi:hypothetical protein